MKATLFSNEQFSAIYPPGVERHYWNTARNMIVEDFLRELEPEGILDVGAGAGIVMSYLKRKGFQIWGVEPAEISIPPDLSNTIFIGATARDVPVEIRNRVDTVLLLDVIEHLPDPERLIGELEACLPKLQKIVVTVPAGKALWNNFDEFNGHYLRYDRPTLVSLLSGLGWKPAYCGYCFHALYWPALILAKLGFKRSVKISTPRGYLGMLHRIFARIFFWEYKILPRFLIGSSIVAVFERSTGSSKK